VNVGNRGLLVGLLGLSAAACQGSPQQQAQNNNAMAPAAANQAAPPAANVTSSTANTAAATQKGPSGTTSADGAAGPGSAQRAAIMDAIRPEIERELRGPVEFAVTRAGVEDGWA